MSVETTRIIHDKEFQLLRPNIEGRIDLSYFPLTPFTIDFENSEILKELYSRANRVYIGSKKGTLSGLQSIAQVTSEVFSIRSTPAVNRFAATTLGEKGEDYSLDDHLKAGIGDCTHSSVTVAALAEQFKRNHLLQGVPSLGETRVDTGDKEEGHVWAKWRRGSKTWVVDVMYGFVGSEPDYAKVLRQIRHDIFMSS